MKMFLKLYEIYQRRFQTTATIFRSNFDSNFTEIKIVSNIINPHDILNNSYKSNIKKYAVHSFSDFFHIDKFIDFLIDNKVITSKLLDHIQESLNNWVDLSFTVIGDVKNLTENIKIYIHFDCYLIDENDSDYIDILLFIDIFSLLKMTKD